ncbi:threonine-phosphate decarboxylase CobD [Minwuia sp.]|uniref:threonine-phosphate decarboxylase CobD n=1 Tax=Minwuia sp. TaxID=2493630 RepID=UPI003A91B5BE
MVNSSMTVQQHGGDLDRAVAQFGGSRADWLDLSTGINPIPYPVPAISQDAWSRLPETSAMARLLETARVRYGSDPSNSIVAGPGVQAFIQLMPVGAPARSAGVLGPTYNEYAHRFEASGLDVRQTDSLEGLRGLDIVAIVSPNNPDGRIHRADDLLKLADHVGLLLVDEAFHDTLESVSLGSRRLPENVIVLRSFGKFFGLAGVRLGFAVAHRDTGLTLEQALGPWAVSGPAIEVGTMALGDTDWIESTCQRLKADMHRLRQLLTGVGFELVGGTDLFVTVRHPEASAWKDRLAAAHVWVRDFDYAPDWLRFGLPGTPARWAQLEAALTG